MNTWVYINHENIDRAKYRECIEENGCSSLYAQDFVWDCLHPNWDLLMFGDYQKLVPLPYKRTYGISTQRQPVFLRTIPLIGSFTEEDKKHVLDILEEQTSLIHLNFTSLDEKTSDLRGNYQYIDLAADYEHQKSAYSTNAKRILNRTFEELDHTESRNCKQFVSFFVEHIGHKHSSMKKEAYENLLLFMNRALEQGIGQIQVLKMDQEWICAAFLWILKGSGIISKVLLHKELKSPEPCSFCWTGP